MSVLCNAMMVGSGSVPFLSGLQLFLDSFDSTTITKSYQNLVATGTGTSGATIITASGVVTNLIQAGMKLRIGGTDIYTVASVSTPTINTVETLSTNYVAQAMALDRISQWNDKSGLGNNATQATALKQPVYNPARLNSQAVITYDNASTLVLPSALYTIPNGDSTLFLVGNQTTLSAADYFIGMTEAGGGRYYLRTDTTDGSIFFLNRTSDANAVTITGVTNANYNIYCCLRSGTTQSIQVNNGTPVTNTSALSENGIDAAYLGSKADAGNYLVGNMPLILLYNRVLSNSEIINVNKWIAQRTAITIS